MDWVHAHILEDLQPISSCTRKGASRFRRKYSSSVHLGGRQRARACIIKWHLKGKDIVKQKISGVLGRKGGRASLGLDAWKNKGSKRRAYIVDCRGD